LELPQLTDQHLDDSFSEAEVRHAIAELPTEKAPGPDGFRGVSFRSCWDIIKHAVMAAFQCIFNQTTVRLPMLNGALLKLLLKTEVVEQPGNIRPISLIHSFAKLVSKILALRLAPYIYRLVSNTLNVFNRRRCIHDNYMYARNLVRAYH
jgi:hypothetical protein